jgi:hypothetical protein
MENSEWYSSEGHHTVRTLKPKTHATSYQSIPKMTKYACAAIYCHLSKKREENVSLGLLFHSQTYWL